MSLNTLILKRALLEWYDEDAKRKEIVKIIVCGEPSESDGKRPPSLREIEYCVINYAKKNGVCYYIPVEGEGGKVALLKPFNMYSSYKSKSASTPDGKDNFDFFRRGDRFDFHGIPDGTTVGQLNFFRWAIENKVIEYVRDNAEAIETDMKKALNKRRKERLNSKSSISASNILTTPSRTRGRKRKKELNPRSPYSCVVYPEFSKTSYDTAIAAKPFKSFRDVLDVEINSVDSSAAVESPVQVAYDKASLG